MWGRFARFFLFAALVLGVPAAAYAGAAGGVDNTTTFTTSTSTSTSHTATTTTVQVGNIWLGYAGSDTVTNAAHGDAPMTITCSYLASSPSTLELLAQGPGSYSGSVYWSLPRWGESGSASVTDVRSFVSYPDSSGRGGQYVYGTYGWMATADPGILYTTLNGRGTVESTSGGYVGSTYTALEASTSSTATSTRVTRQVTSSTSAVTVGDFTLGTNTDVNTDTNTNTSYDTHTTAYTGTGVTDEYEVNATVSVSPIVLDLSHTGRFTASGGEWRPHRGLRGTKLVMFDLRGNGMQMLTEWIGPGEGLLVAPKADGTVDGSCLFGTAGGFDNGFEKLSARDANHDGALTGRELKGLFVWVDANRNGRLERGELRTLASLGITRLNLGHRDYRGTFVMRGRLEQMWDWWPTALDVRHVAHRTGGKS